MRIVALEPLGVSHESLSRLTAPLIDGGHDFIYYKDRVEDTETLIERSTGADILIVSNLPLNGEVIRACTRLKMISVAFTGIDHIDVNTCAEKDIRVCNAAGYSTHSVAELAFGLMLAVMRKIVSCDEVIRKGGTRVGLLGNELYGKTLGIIGTGAIGMRVAEIGRAFGCNLLGYSRTRRDEAVGLGISYVTLEDLLKKSDIVTIHTPLSEATRMMINRERLALMKPTAILINTSRGPVVNSEALTEALNEGGIAGAGVDVFEMEPPIPGSHPLLNARNVVAAPHVAFATSEAIFRRAEITFDNIVSWMDGKPENVVL